MGSLAPGKGGGGGGRREQKSYISVTYFEPLSSRMLRHAPCPCAHLCSSMERKNVACP